MRTTDERAATPPSLGVYDAVELLSVGGGGQVWRALRSGAGAEELVVKVAAQRHGPAADALWREWQCLFSVPSAALPHPVDWLPATEDQPAAIVMERRQGRPFLEALEGAEEAVVARAVEAALRSLVTLHGAGLVHGDLHPGNLLVGSTGAVSLLDLGLAEAPGVAPAVGAGLPEFAAPERLAGDGVDVRDDIFSLAVCAWVALTGAHPFANYPAMMPDRQQRPLIPAAARKSRALKSLAAWLSPVRELRPNNAELALREWREVTGKTPDVADKAALLKALVGRPWRWGQWGEQSLLEVPQGHVAWVVGPTGSGRTGVLRALEADAAGAVAWLRPSDLPDFDPLESLRAEISRRDGATLTLTGTEAGATEQAFAGLGEHGGVARALLQQTIDITRQVLGESGVLMVDDFEALPESHRAAVMELGAVEGAASVVVAAMSAPAEAMTFLIPPVSASSVGAFLTAATGDAHDLEVCRAIAGAVGYERAGVVSIAAQLWRANHLRSGHGRAQPAADVASLRALTVSMAANRAQIEQDDVPADPEMRALLAHALVSSRVFPGQAGDPAPALTSDQLDTMTAVRPVGGGGYAVASERHRDWLSRHLPVEEVANAALARAAWLAPRAPTAALELRLIARGHGAKQEVAAEDVAAAAALLIAQAQPERAARLCQQWVTQFDDAQSSLSVHVAEIRALTALGRYDEANARAVVAHSANDALAHSDLNLALADNAFRAGNYPEAMARAQQVWASTADASCQVKAAVLQAFAATWQGDLDAASTAIDAGRKLAGAAQAEGQFAYLLALASYYRGDVEVAQRAFERLDRDASSVIRAAAAAGLGLCAHRAGKLLEARAHYDRSRGLAELAGDRGRVLNMTMNIAVLDHEAGDLGRALVGYNEVSAAATRLGNRGALARSRNNRGNLLALLGDHETASSDLAAALDEMEGAGNQYLEGNIRCVLAEIARKSGRVKEAMSQIESALATMDIDDASVEQLEWQMEHSECRLTCGDLAGARDIAEEVLRTAATLKSGELQARAGWMLARCDLRDDHNEELLADIDGRLRACAAAVPESKVLLRVAVDAELAVVKATQGDIGAAVALASDSLSRLQRVAATLGSDRASAFRNSPTHAPTWALLQLLANLKAGEGAPSVTGVVGGAAMNAVLALNRRMSAEHDLSRLLEVLMDAAIALTGAERGFLVLDERAAPKAVSDIQRAGVPDLKIAIARNLDQENLRKPGLKLSWSVAMDVFEDGERVVTTDASTDPRFSTQASVHSGNLRSILSVPLALRGRTIGVLYVDNRFTSGAFSQEHAGVLEALAAQAAIAIHTARLIAQYQRSKQQLQASKAEVELLNEKLQVQLSDTVEKLSTATEALDAQRLEIERRSDYRQIKGESALLRRLFALMDRVRKHDFPVIVQGESGTGKELVARAIHFTGTRKRGPFVAINCGAVPENLLESELFGHKRGAFTGAVAEREGLFVSADRGTLFLDEVGEMPLSMQVKLLRVLQTGEVQAVGGSTLRTVDVRVLAATHRDLDEMVEKGSFREDLLYRLRVVQMRVPPLRERTDDLPLLADHFLAANRDSGLGRVRKISSRAMSVMRGYAWPGNIRELETFLKSACLFADGETLDVADVAELTQRAQRGGSGPNWLQGSVGSFPSEFATGTLEQIERAIIADRLQRLGGNKSRTAQSLGIDRGTLYNKLRDED